MTAISTDIALQFDNVSLGYDLEPAVHRFSGTVARGALTAIVGPNGSGKSTLMKGIIGALKPLSGTIAISGARRKDIAYLPQQAEIDRSFPISVFDLVSLGLWRSVGAFSTIGRREKVTIEASLAAVGLAGFEGRTIGALSGGQLQRVLFARVLVQDSPLILLDEPFAAIDRKTTLDLMKLLNRWHGEKRTVLAVMHDIDLVREEFPETILIAREPVAWGATDKALTAANMLKARSMSEMWMIASVAASVQTGSLSLMLYDALVAPFADYAFMRRALVGTVVLSLGAAPVGVFLLLRRMSLVGDAIAHGILPGAAIGFLLFGLEIMPMTIGGIIAGLTIAVAAGLVARTTVLREDASLAAFYLISLAFGVLIVSARGSSVDLMHVLFGTVLALDNTALVILAATTTISLFVLAAIIRILIAECVDPSFLAVVSGGGSVAHLLFLMLVVLNLVAAFQALGTLLAVGLMMLPAASARMWARSLELLIGAAVIIAIGASIAGLLVSYHYSLASGPAIILSAGVVYVVSLIVGPISGLVWRILPPRHRQA